MGIGREMVGYRILTNDKNLSLPARIVTLIPHLDNFEELLRSVNTPDAEGV